MWEDSCQTTNGHLKKLKWELKKCGVEWMLKWFMITNVSVQLVVGCKITKLIGYKRRGRRWDIDGGIYVIQ
jgi:hypothetical protein